MLQKHDFEILVDPKGLSTEYHSPDRRDILKFEVGAKMTELWPKTNANIGAYAQKLVIFGTYPGQIPIFLNETNFIR